VPFDGVAANRLALANKNNAVNLMDFFMTFNFLMFL
jgi:hypothetical protein